MSRLKTTIKAWPAVFMAAVALSLLTQGVAKPFGIDLPDQAQVEFVRKYAGWNMVFLFIVFQILVMMPVFEEIVFRWLLWRLPLACCGRWRGLRRFSFAVATPGAALFSFAHYVDYAQLVQTRSLALTGWNSAFIALFFFGMAQCWLYRRTDRLWCSMLNHALFNTTNLALIFVI